MRTFCGACVLTSLLAFGLACSQQTPAGAARKIDSAELAKLLESPENIYFLDVREPQEIAKLGSVKGYVNIPLSQLESRLQEVPRDKVIVTL